MSGYIDLHCHYVPGVDDGVRTMAETTELLQRLADVGFSKAVATPHMRTGLFDNTRQGLMEVFESVCSEHRGLNGVPELGLAAENFFDDVFLTRFARGECILYPGARAILIEFMPAQFPVGLAQALAEIQAAGVLPVIAHPERYLPLQRHSDELFAFLDEGAVALLDVMSVIGKYGTRAQEAALRLVDEGAYVAACTDTHKPSDVELVSQAFEELGDLLGERKVDELFVDGPLAILDGSAS